VRTEPLKRFLPVVAWLLFASLPLHSQSDGERPRNLIHFGDLIEVDVIGSYEHDWRGSINPEGYLDGLDELDEQIYALCRSEDEVSAAVAKEYARTLRDPKVAVRILDRSNRAVAFLSGAVRIAQRFQIKRPVHLNELLILSGGITDRSSGEVSIFRPANLSCAEPAKDAKSEFVKASQPGGSETMSIKIADILRGDQSSNPRIYSGESITVSEALPVYLIGGVNAPQQISLRNKLTLSRAIAMAGGLAKETSGSITIFRREGREAVLIQADLQKITAGQAEDPILKPFDIVDVPLKGRPSRVRPPVVDRSVSKGQALANLPLRVID
jgi:protein involved in polysaccharide export with SLBB domain